MKSYMLLRCEYLFIASMGVFTVFAYMLTFDSIIKAYPPDAHWFCPKIDEDDDTNYNDVDTDDGDVSSKDKSLRITEGGIRQDNVYSFIRVLGLPADSAQEIGWKDWYTQRVHSALTSCDKCVRNYHLGRARLLTKLREYV